MFKSSVFNNRRKTFGHIHIVLRIIMIDIKEYVYEKNHNINHINAAIYSFQLR